MPTDRAAKETQEHNKQQNDRLPEGQEFEVASPAPFHEPHTGILRLQHQVGNQGVQRLLAGNRPPISRTAHYNGLPPVRGVPTNRPKREEQSYEEQSDEEEVAQANGPILAQAAAADAPPGDGVAGSPGGIQPARIQHQSGAPGVQRGVWGWIKNKAKKAAEWAFKKALSAAGVPIGTIWGFLKKAGSAFFSIIKHPGRFLGNLIGGVKQGFSQFTANIMTHLKAGFLSWLFGALNSAGLQIPKDFSMKSILTLVMQVLGVTVDALRQRLAKFIGEKNVARIEKGWQFISKFISDGVGGLWELMKDSLSDLKETVVGEIQNWVVVEIIKGAVGKILSMFNPASGLIQIVMMIYRVVKFFIQRASQIASLVQAVMGSVAAIAAGNAGLLAKKIEESLARAIPLVIGFLASFFGIGSIAGKVREIIQRIQLKVQNAIDAVLKKIAKGVKKLFGKGGSSKQQKEATRGDADKQAQVKSGLAAFHTEEKKYLKEGAITKSDAEAVASTVKKQYPVFASVNVVEGIHKDVKTWDYDYAIQRSDTDETGKKQAENGDQSDDPNWPAAETVLKAAKRFRGSPNEIERIRKNLHASPAGQAIMQHLAGGVFTDTENYEEVFSKLKDKSQMNQTLAVINEGKRLKNQGYHIIWEIDQPGIDIDIAANTVAGVSMNGPHDIAIQVKRANVGQIARRITEAQGQLVKASAKTKIVSIIVADTKEAFDNGGYLKGVKQNQSAYPDIKVRIQFSGGEVLEI